MKAQNKRTVKDIDGNIYKTVNIGPQVWMDENLKVTHYRNGDPIPIRDKTDGLAWNHITTCAYCDYENDPENSKIYGKLYNFYAVQDNRNIAPFGWHIPSDTEWTTLINYLGGACLAESKLIDPNTTHWKNPNKGANNESGFMGLPGGCRRRFDDWENIGIRDIEEYYNNICEALYAGKGDVGFWWTTNEDYKGGKLAICRSLGSLPEVEPIADPEAGNALLARKYYGLSVRCLKDDSELLTDHTVEEIKNNGKGKISEIVTDIDGNVYHTVTIGTQEWMIENLRVTRFRNGDPVSNVTDGSTKHDFYKGICYNSMPENSSHGLYYTYHAVHDLRNLAPLGWHIPSDFEWKILAFFLGGKSSAGGKLKEIGTIHWNEPNAGATNDSGFTALPSGCFIFGKIHANGENAYLWSSSKHITKHSNGMLSTTDSQFILLARDSKLTNRTNLGNRYNAYSVRCIRNFSLFNLIIYVLKRVVAILYPVRTKKKLKIQKPIIEWANIPAGKFTMGSPEWGSPQKERGSRDNEFQHEVILSAFKMSKYEVTFEQYDLFCEETGRKKPYDENWGRGKRPVINVTWKDAKAFADWMGCRLPTEAEWEYACRAGTQTPFNTGAELTYMNANFNDINSECGNDREKYRQQTMPVGSFAPNAWDLYDMHGNVCEWVSDWYNNWFQDFSPGVQKDPQGPVSGKHHVYRGGAWNFWDYCCRSAYRSDGYYLFNSPFHFEPGEMDYGDRDLIFWIKRRNYVGFRLVTTV